MSTNGKVRAVKLFQYEIFTITQKGTNFPDLNFTRDALVYCTAEANNPLLELTEDINNSKNLFRIIDKVVLNKMDAFTFIVSKTIDEPDYNLEKENDHIEKYFNGRYLTYDWDFKLK